MADHDPRGTDWTDREIDLIVADYFDMLRLELVGQHFVKKRRNEAFQELTGRSRSSIEWKYRNISAVLEWFGRPWLTGYAPAANYQGALTSAIDERLTGRGAAFLDALPQAETVLAEQVPLYFEPAPTLVQVESVEPPELKRLIRKFDPAERDARNRELGKRGEHKTLLSEHAKLRNAGRDDLARKVRWVSEEDGDGAGYDIRSFDVTGSERWLEVKTTTGHQTTPFYLTENEREVSTERPDVFRLVRLYDFARKPRAFELVPPLEASVMLRPMGYRATFR